MDVHTARVGVARWARVQAGVSLDRLLDQQTAGSHGSLLRDQADPAPRRVEVNRLRNRKEDGQSAPSITAATE